MLALIPLLLASALDASAATPHDEAALLDAHNALRASVGVGASPLPAAGDLQGLLWDPALAAVAQGHADRCQVRHNPDRLTEFLAASGLASFDLPSGGSLGENVAARSGGAGLPPPSWAVDLWSAEATSFEYGPWTQASVSTAGHIAQLVWSDTRYVGCGVASCPGLFGSRPGELVVCNYFPSGNIPGRLPYEEPPAACPLDRPYRVDEVCLGCADPGHLATGSASPPDVCTSHPMTCGVDADCAVLDACTDDGDTAFEHACVAGACELAVVDCSTGCATGPCGCPDGDGDGTCDAFDLCAGEDAFGDADASGVCDPALHVDAVVRGQALELEVVNARPGARVFVLGSVRGAGTTCAPGGQVCADLANVVALASGPAGAGGVARFTLQVPTTLPVGRTLSFQALWVDGALGEKSAVVTRVVR